MGSKARPYVLWTKTARDLARWQRYAGYATEAAARAKVMAIFASDKARWVYWEIRLTGPGHEKLALWQRDGMSRDVIRTRYDHHHPMFSNQPRKS